MKLILILGTSASAAGLAIGFAMFANQALSRESDIASAPRPILPSRIAPDLAVSLTPVVRDYKASYQIADKAPVEAEMVAKVASVSTAGNSAIVIGETPAASSAQFVPLLTPNLAERPPRKPVVVSYNAPSLAVVATPELGRIPASNFENLPLIGVYR